MRTHHWALEMRLVTPLLLDSLCLQLVDGLHLGVRRVQIQRCLQTQGRPRGRSAGAGIVACMRRSLSHDTCHVSHERPTDQPLGGLGLLVDWPSILTADTLLYAGSTSRAPNVAAMVATRQGGRRVGGALEAGSLRVARDAPVD